MNEPSNFDTGTYNTVEEQLASAKLSCPITGSDSSLDVPPYPTQAVYQRNGEYLFSKTLCMLGKTAHRTRDFYDTKNLYGWSEARATYQAIPQVCRYLIVHITHTLKNMTNCTPQKLFRFFKIFNQSSSTTNTTFFEKFRALLQILIHIE